MSEWKFKEGAEPQGSGDFWYDLTDGGYIDIEGVLKNEDQIKELTEAIKTVDSFYHALDRAGLLNE